MGLTTVLFGIVGACLLAGDTVSGADVSVWSEPSISSVSGTGTATAKLTENIADAGATVVTIAATGANSYALTTATSHGVTFSINSASGLLTKDSGTIDFETSPTYVIVVEATGDSNVGTATITLSVTDANEPPAFLPANAAVSLTDGSGAGTTVHTVNGTDHDAGTNGNIAGYTITAGNTNTDFAISSAGVITVNTGKTIASATTSSYFLEVKANDGATPSLTGTTTIAIAVVAPSSAALRITVSMTTVLLAILFAYLK